MERKPTTIVMMDVVGYSRLMELGEAGTPDRLKSVRAGILDPAIARRKGRMVKLMGEGTLAEFGSVVEGLQCTVDIQEEVSMTIPWATIFCCSIASAGAASISMRFSSASDPASRKT